MEAGVKNRRSGVALILVLTVILALSLIATPFVLSMLLHEKSGVSMRYGSQAEWGAFGSVEFGKWRLMRGVNPLERKYNPDSWFWDDQQEMEVRLDEAYLAKANILDRLGSIWGVVVQDEQSKINTRTAHAGIS